MVSATENGSAAADTPICFVKELPARLHERAADYAVQVHRLNTPMLSATVAMEPGQLAVITGKYWGPNPRVLTVSFMESPAADFRARVLEHMNAWDCSISFVQVHTASFLQAHSVQHRDSCLRSANHAACGTLSVVCVWYCAALIA